jgi:apolipoprotein N-acyltransferase
VISAQAAAAPGTRADVAAATLRIRWALLVSLAGGLALAASFPPYGLWPLAAAGPALLVVALAGRSPRGSFLCGLVFGLAFFVPLISWLINVAWYAWAALAIAESLIFAVLTIGQRLLLRLRFWPLAVAGWWVLAEGIRDRWPWAFPWGRLAMTQAGAPDARWMAIGGAPWLTFLLALTGAVCAWVALRALARPRAPLTALRLPVCVAAGVAGVVLSIGLVPVDPVGGAPATRVAAIQGNVPRARNLPQQLNDIEVTANHAAATSKLAAAVRAGRLPAPDIVLWPENATDIDPFTDPAIYNEIMSSVNAIGRPILVGEVLDNPRRNAGQLWTPGTGPGEMYVKRQLVPFGEYVPLRGFVSTFTSLPSLQPVDFTPGRNAVVFGVGQIRLGDVICYEVGFDPLVRSEVTAGANLLVVQSNDADFEIDGQSGESSQQVAMARLRAIENDRAVVYVSTTGESAIIAPDGRVITGSGLWQQAILIARVPLVSYRTLATRIGSWPEYVIIALTVLALAFAAGMGLRATGSMRWSRLRSGTRIGTTEGQRARQ